MNLASYTPEFFHFLLDALKQSFLHFIVHSETVFTSIVASNAWKSDGTGIFCMDRVNDLGGITNLSSMPFLSDRK